VNAPAVLAHDSDARRYFGVAVKCAVAVIAHQILVRFFHLVPKIEIRLIFVERILLDLFVTLQVLVVALGFFLFRILFTESELPVGKRGEHRGQSEEFE
jgi:hypothetical protein